MIGSGEINNEMVTTIVVTDRVVCGNRLRESNELRENMDTMVEAHGII